MWHLKTTTVPLIMEVQRMIKKKNDKGMNKIANSPNVYEIQKIYIGGLHISLS